MEMKLVHCVCLFPNKSKSESVSTAMHAKRYLFDYWLPLGGREGGREGRYWVDELC